MSDLISRSALLQEFEKYNKMQDRDLWHITGIKAFIENQPIAYDVDKVVEEIKRVGTAYCVSIHCNNECSNCDHGSIMRSIIEIVKGGGLNGTNCT